MRKPGVEKRPQLTIDREMIHGMRHAGQPLVTLVYPDRERSMPHPQLRMTAPLHVELWPTQPSAQEFEEFLPALVKVVGVHPSDDRILRRVIHPVIEGIN
jgi:hypothetical protein